MDYPKRISLDLAYILTDSIKIKILNDSLMFKVYKSKENYLIEGQIIGNYHAIKTQVFFDDPLKLCMFGKSRDYNYIEIIFKILKSIELKNKMPAANKQEFIKNQFGLL